MYVRLYQEDRKIAYGRAVRMLVADAFIPNPENAKRVKHKDGDKLNVCVDNLYWNVRPPKLQHKGKPTVRYDLNGNQEKVYDRLVDVEKDGYRRTMVSHAISQCVPYKKKLWSH